MVSAVRSMYVAGLVALCVTAAGCSAAAEPSTAERPAASEPTTAVSLADLASQLQGHVAKAWPRTSRIWPGADFTDHVLLISDGHSAWLIDKNHSREVPVADLAKHGVTVPAHERGFDALTWDGRRGIIVRPQQKAEADPTGFDAPDVALRTFGLATHEQFHTYVQQDKAGDWTWKSISALEEKAEGVSDRAQRYPEDFKSSETVVSL